MSNHTLKVRDTIVIDLKHQAGLDIIQPEKVEIHIGGEFKNPIDIGALCYQTRTSKRTGVHSGFKTEVFVVEDTFLAHRRELISSLLETLATKVYRPATIRGYIQRISRAVDYIDENEGFAMLLRSKQDALSIYRDICAKLKDETQNSTITPHYASYMIDNIIRTLEIRFGKQFTDYLRHAFARVTSKKRKVAPRSDEAYKATFNFYHSIAEQISNFIIVNNSFPLKLKMPEYETYLFPNSNFLVTPYCNRPANIYDHEKGVIRSLNELWKEGEYIRRKYDLIHTISGSKETLNLANKEHSFARGNLVSKGLLSYRLLFMMLTGAYESEILQLESLDELEIDKCVVHKGFRAVKFRSAGRTVQYDLADGGVQVLKSYLKLRKYVLKGERHPQLFFNFLSRDWKPSKNRNELNRFQTRHIHGKLLPDKTKSITARECRKFKSVFLHEQPDVKKDTVKDVLNHSEKVNEEYYMDVSEDKASSELNDFWSAAKEAANHIRTTGTEPNTDSPIAAGHCESPHNPKQAVEDPPIFPNCKSQYGCLFCEHYVCHADDSEDIHKLFSLLYIVLGVLDGTSDMSKADELLKKLSVRVRSILNKVNNMSYASAQIVKKCRSLVFEYGELTPYWENRLQRYESLGLIFKEPPMGSEK